MLVLETGIIRVCFLEERWGSALPEVGGYAPPPELLLSLPEHLSMGPGGATLSWGRPEDPGFNEVPSLYFCQLALPALPSKWHVEGGHFLASIATNFCGNAVGCVLRALYFPKTIDHLCF